MTPELKAKWLEALRSGRYSQTRNALRRETLDSSDGFGYCCLGVLVDVASPEKWNNGITSTWGYPPENFLLNAGLPRQLALELAVENDSGKSFAEIAKKIETEVPEEEEA